MGTTLQQRIYKYKLPDKTVFQTSVKKVNLIQEKGGVGEPEGSHAQGLTGVTLVDLGGCSMSSRAPPLQ